jgi:GR25 family glycosyltransferase involved in LPS biosynthesis
MLDNSCIGEDNEPKVVIYYINLERRQDRNDVMVKTFQEVDICGRRINAIDSDCIKDDEKMFLPPPEVACWLSHRKAIQTFVEESSSIVCLILEDDVEFDPTVNWKSFLNNASRFIVENRFDLLQIGHLSARYRFRLSPSRLYEYYLHFRYRYRSISSPLGTIRMNEFRVGAHAYMLSKEGAKKLLGANVPPIFPADGFYAFLAEVQDGRDIFRVGRLQESLINQYTRNDKLRPSDSDISLP